MTMAHILICDNNTVFTDYLKDEIARLFPDRFTVSVCSSADTLRAEAARQTPDIVLMDILLGEDNGIELVKDFVDLFFPVFRQETVHIGNVSLQALLSRGLFSQLQVRETASGRQEQRQKQRAYPFYHSFSSSSACFFLISTQWQIRSTQPSMPRVPVSTHRS